MFVNFGEDFVYEIYIENIISRPRIVRRPLSILGFSYTCMLI